jgi:nucleoside-diphosphate-sugar epimerase
LDISDVSVEDWKQILKPGDVLFHLAAEKYNSSKSTPERVISCNVIGTERLFRAAAEIAIKRVVFTSSLYAYGSLGPGQMIEEDVLRPRTIYGASKAFGEDLLRIYALSHGLSYNVARLFFIYGPSQYAEGGYKPPVVYGSGDQVLDYVYIDDCIGSLLLMSETRKDGLTVNIASGTGVTINDLTRSMLRVSGSNLSPRHGPADWTDGTVRVGSPHCASDTLGWKTVTSLDSGLSRVWQWTNKI